MGQVLKQDVIATLVKTGDQTLIMGPSIITIGGQQYQTLTNLPLSTATLGIGGLDVGSWAINTHYFIYAIVEPTYRTVGLIGTLSSNAPTGYAAYRKVAEFDSDSNIYITNLVNIVPNGTIQGATGVRGLTGIGYTGATGLQGPQGETGALGSTGAGIQGATGIQGLPGIQGSTGLDLGPNYVGATGIHGIQGVTGLSAATNAYGNAVYPLSPSRTQFTLSSPDLTLWAITASTSGEIVVETIPYGAVDNIYFITEDSRTVSLVIDDDGQITVDETLKPGGTLYSPVYLADSTGLAYNLTIDANDNIILATPDSNSFQVKNSVGVNVFKAEDVSSGTILQAKHFSGLTGLPTPNVESGSTPFGIADDGTPYLIVWNSTTNTWNKINGSGVVQDSFPLGSLLQSVLSEAEFRAEMGDNGTKKRWILMKSQLLSTTDDLRTLKGWNKVPDGQGMFLRQVDDSGLVDSGSRTLHEGGVLGSSQIDTLMDHGHGAGGTGGSLSTGAGTTVTTYTMVGGLPYNQRVSNETRPKNIAVNTFIKINR